MKKIVVVGCEQCPYITRSGGFGYPQYTPKCKKADKELPHTTKVNGNQIMAVLIPVIPDWCPLEDDK